MKNFQIGCVWKMECSRALKIVVCRWEWNNGIDMRRVKLKKMFTETKTTQ